MPLKSSAELVDRQAHERKKPKEFKDTMAVEIPKFMLPFFKDFLEEAVDKYKTRPYPVRDPQQAWGIIGEEWDELKREIRHTKVGDSFEKVIHDVCELAVVSAMSYVDLTQVEESRKK